MKKTVILFSGMICLLLLFAVGRKTSLATEGRTETKEWKEYSLSLVDKTKMKTATFLKALTPSLMKRKKYNPENFPVYATGKVEGVAIALIDDNNNEQYDEAGVDVMVIGDSPYGVPVSSIINIKNKLYKCRVDTEGESISLAPYEGATGELDLTSEFKSSSPLDLAIVTSNDSEGGSVYLDVAKSKKNIVPAGTYTLWLGYVGEGTTHLAIRRNDMSAIEVKSQTDENGKSNNKPVVVKWGNPCRMDFRFSINEDKIKLPYSSIQVFGSAGEEYYNFDPPVVPSLEILDAKGQIVTKGGFPVSC